MIHEAIAEYYAAPRPAYKGSGRIYVSSFGRCLRSVMLGLSGVKGKEFPAHIREIMDLGSAFEATTSRALAARFGMALRSEVQIANSIWSGRMDFLVLDGERVPTIVEHKALGDKWFDSTYAPLPKFEHLCQAWLYGQLYQEKNGITPRVVLYYRAWGQYAELELGLDKDVVRGSVNGEPVIRHVLLSELPARRALFEKAYAALPNVPEPPCAAPSDDVGCTFRGCPSCAFYQQCWE